MEYKMFNIQLTKNGKTWLSKQVINENPVKIYVAIGDGNTIATEEDVELKNHKMWANDSEVEKLIEDNGLHISANFLQEKNSNLEFNINEIGVFVENQSNEKILLGRYGSEQALAKKTGNIDLLIDILLDFKNYNTENLIIDASQYKPQFKNNYASYTQPGTVRFASEKDIAAGKKGLAISSEMLNAPGIITRQALKDDCHIVNAEVEIGFDSSSAKISSLFYDNNNKVYCLFYIKEKTVLVIPYNLMAKKFELQEKMLADTPEIESVPDMHLYKQEDTKLYFLGFTKNNSSIYDFSLEKKTKKITPSMKGNSLDRHPKGTLTFYNNNSISVGGKESTVKIVRYDGQQNNLKNSRKLPLVHVIQDKLYCLGGEEKKDTQILEILKPFSNSNEAYNTPIPDNFDLTDTTNLTSSILGHRIYIFDKKNFTENERRFYSYDYLSGHWRTHKTIVHSTEVISATNKSAKSITAGNTLYICFCVPNTKSLKLKMVQYVPA